MTLPPESISSSKLQDHVREFLSQFKDKSGSYRYVDEIDQMMAKKIQYIVVDYNNLVTHPDIESVFNTDPDEILRAFSGAIKDILKERFPQYAEKIRHDIRVRISNYPAQRSLREVNAEVIGKMISVSGMVVRASEIKPLAKELVYICPEGHQTKRVQEKGLEFKEPLKCDNGKCTHRDLELNPEESKFIDFQMVRLQELPEDLPPGQLPHYLDVTVLQDLVDNARPGDRVILTGIVRIEQEHIPSMRGKSGIYRLRIQGNNIEFLGGRGNKSSRSTEREEISPDEEKIIKSLGKNPDIYDRLVASFAPHVNGHDIIKESILLLIVGSTQKLLADGAKIRGDINVFLVGDPGCLDGSSKVILGDGKIVGLASLGQDHLEQINVRMQNENGTDIATVFHKYENQKVIEIITESGKRLVGTYNHPLLTRRGWKRFDELKGGDELRTITHIPCRIKKYMPSNFQVVTGTSYQGKIPEFIDEELAGFMGFLTGCGWVRKSGYRLGYVVSQKDEDKLLPSLLQTGNHLFGVKPKITKKECSGQIVMMNNGRQATRSMYFLNVAYDSQNIAEMLGFLKCDSRSRYVPPPILQSPNSVVSSYLKWLFEAGGTVFNMGRAERTVQLKSTSIQLLRDVQILLLRFGIHSRVIQHNAGGNLVIRHVQSIVKYAKHIGFVSSSKAEKLNNLIKWALDISPVAKHDGEYEKVSQINYLKEPQTVYDVEIPRSHKFIADGIVSHNTAKSEMLKFCARIAPRGLYTSGRGSTAAGLTAAVVRDKIGIMMLEAGAVVLGDQGLVCMTEDTEIYTGSALTPVGKLWDGIQGPTFITKSGRDAKKGLIPVGIYDNRSRVDIDGHAFAIMRKKYKGDVIKITLSSGLVLKLTPEHLMRRHTNVKNLWIKARDVKPGQLLRSPVRVPKPGFALNITEQDAYVVGCICGDGHTTAHGITISQSGVNSDVMRNIQKNSDLFSVFDKDDRFGMLGKCALVSQMYHLYSADKGLLQKTRFLIKNPSIDNILLLSDKSLWAFLAGLFDTDGDFNHVGGKIVAARLYPALSHHDLTVLLYALRRFGICGRIRKMRKELPLIQIAVNDVSRFADGIKPYSIKAGREEIETSNKGSGERGIEKVVSVERVPYDGYVYDLSVGKHHNYEASLVYIHNCIDEFDKMKPEDRSALHETMEQQSVSIAKGGIVATLNARTSILAAANPMYGKYDPFKNITENVNLPVPLLTRFDLIFVVRDIPSKEKDARIARHILSLHRTATSDTKSLIDVDILTKYLTFAKRFDPILTPEAEEKILQYYMTMRNVESEGMITVTPRQLEGLIRLATARARLLMKTQVDGEDAERAIFLIQSMLQDAGVDVNTGKVDLGVLQGRPHSEVSKMQLFMDVIKSLEGDEKRPVEEKTFVKELVKTGKFTEEEARKYIKKLQRESAIYESKPGHYNRV